MELAIVADVHGNLTALDAVIADLERRGVARVVHGGDLAQAGAQGAECVDRVRELGWPGIVGNTDEVCWRPELRDELIAGAPGIAGQLGLVFDRYGPATSAALGDERVAWLRELPAEHREDGALVLVHAAPGNLWRAPMPDAEDATLVETYGGLGAPLAVYCHIHRPFVRTVGSLTVANTGAVGAPFDGDPRASYLLVRDGAPEVVRVEYDVEREVAVLAASDYPNADRIAEMRRTGTFMAPPG